MNFNKKALSALVIGCLALGSVNVAATSIKNKDKNLMSINGSEIKEQALYDNIMFGSGFNATLSVLDSKVLEEKYKKDSRLKSMIEEKYNEELESNKEDDPKMEKAFASFGVSSKDDYIKKSGIRLTALRELAAIDTAYDEIFTKEEKQYVYDTKFSGTLKLKSILIEPLMSAKDNGNEEIAKKAKAEALKKAEAAIKEINDGASFDATYKKYSADKVLENGYIGTFTVEQAHKANLDQNVISEAFSMADKSVSTKPIETSRGYEIITVEYTEAKKEYDEVKNDIAQMLFDLYQGNNSYTREYALDIFRRNEKIELTDAIYSKQYANNVLQNRKSFTTFDPEAQNNGYNFGY